MSEIKYKEPRLIKEWMHDFAELYSDSDKERSPEEFWIATMSYCSVIGESIRRINYPRLMKAAAHAFCWICSYVHYCNNTEDLILHCNHTLCDIVFLKFPNVCGHCLENPCKCDPFKMDEKKDKSADYRWLLDRWKERRKIEGHKIDEWLNIFKDIYGGQNHLQTLESIGFHFLEEAGEEAMAVRQLVQMRGILNGGVKGLEKEFLETLASIEGLVDEYINCPKDDENKPKIVMESNDLEHVKTRLVKAKMDFVIELADTFSWFCAILIKISRIVENIEVNNPELYDLEKFLQTEYKASPEGLTCPTCTKRPCKCCFFPQG